MKCPECGHDTKVTNSRYMKHHVWRRRECLYCYHRHTTKEYEANYVDKLIRFYKANSESRSNDVRQRS